MNELLRLADLNRPAIIDGSVVDSESDGWRYRFMAFWSSIDGRVGILSDSEPERGNPVVP